MGEDIRTTAENQQSKKTHSSSQSETFAGEAGGISTILFPPPLHYIYRRPFSVNNIPQLNRSHGAYAKLGISGILRIL